MCKCKYCDKEFETTRKMISHLRHCKLNPNYEKNLELQLKAAKKHEVVDNSVENEDAERKSYSEFAEEGIPEDSSILHPTEYPIK